jgi:anti-sigma B factor antagonist
MAIVVAVPGAGLGAAGPQPVRGGWSDDSEWLDDAELTRAVFSATWVEGDESSCLRLAGELDLSCAGALRAALADAVDTAGSRVVIDLSGVDFVDSVCLGEIFAAAKTVEQSGRAVSLVGMRGQVLRTLRLLGL